MILMKCFLKSLENKPFVKFVDIIISQIFGCEYTSDHLVDASTQII